MARIPAETVDAVVTDPPYHLTARKKGGAGDASLNLDSPAGRSRVTTGFMNQRWDGGDIAHRPELWAEVRRVAKPGTHLLAFGGARTFHRLTCAIEDAGWEIRDCISWLFGSGFPKSLNVGDGRGTALKPGWEPIILARKPLVGTVAATVQECGTGALNIDACRIEGPQGTGVWGSSNATVNRDRTFNASPTDAGYRSEQHPLGRWPANVAIDEEAAALLDEQSGELTSGANPRHRGSNKSANTYNEFAGQRECTPARGLDHGGASRFFYCAKARRGERDAGLTGEKKPLNWSAGTQSPGTFQSPNTERAVRNHHPTVKPLDLMQWLCRLITPPNGLVLDPFCGSGTTGRAALAEGLRFMGIEIEPEYAAIAEARLAEYAPLFIPRAEEVGAPAAAPIVPAATPSLFDP